MTTALVHGKSESLRSIRTSKGTLLDAYEATGVRPESWSRYENGHHVPSIEIATKMSGYLGITAEKVQRLALRAKKEREAAQHAS